MKICGPAESLLSSKFTANQASLQPQGHLGLSPSIWNSVCVCGGALRCWEDSPGSLSLQHMSRAPPTESSAAWLSLSLLWQDEKREMMLLSWDQDKTLSKIKSLLLLHCVPLNNPTPPHQGDFRKRPTFRGVGLQRPEDSAGIFHVKSVTAASL